LMATIDERKAYEAVYDFDGNNEAEIEHVAEGDIVIALPQEKRDDWILVVTLKTPRKRGYVPITFLKDVASSKAVEYFKQFDDTDGDSGAPPTTAAPSSTPPSSSTAPSAPALSPLSSSLGRKPFTPASTSLSTPSARMGLASNLRARSRFPTPGAGSRTPLAARGSTGESFNEMFARHEHYFKQVMKQREESFKKLEMAMQAAAQDIRQCQEKNNKLSQRIVDLDGLIEEERKRWKERLEAEKKTLLMKGGVSPTVGPLQ